MHSSILEIDIFLMMFFSSSIVVLDLALVVKFSLLCFSVISHPKPFSLCFYTTQACPLLLFISRTYIPCAFTTLTFDAISPHVSFFRAVAAEEFGFDNILFSINLVVKLNTVLPAHRYTFFLTAWACKFIIAECIILLLYSFIIF